MIIRCPECKTRYDVPDTALGGGGRTVACARCGTRWHAVPEPEAPKPRKAAAAARPIEPDTITAPSDPAYDVESAAAHLEGDEAANYISPEDLDGELFHDEPPETKRKRRIKVKSKQPRRGVSAHFLLLVASFGIAGLGIWMRDAVVRMVPEAAALYELVGLDVNLVGLDFTDLSFSRIQENGTPVLVISGKIVNVGEKGTFVPAIRLSLQTRENKELFSWVTEPPAQHLEAGAATDFTARLASPPEDAANVIVRFAPRERMTLGMKQ
ncbi:MAG: zinc-ribbon domain-containing protein [Rhodobiaceae bacterium]|nr:zinc-ribbon domain-containing protein [Rhodobiaceae bacterium]